MLASTPVGVTTSSSAYLGTTPDRDSLVLGLALVRGTQSIILQTMKLQSAAALTLVFILATVAQAHPSAPATAQSPQLAKRGLRSGAVKMAGAYLGYKAAGAGIDKLRETKKD
ncbi:hypothetical protein BJ085DRAFT_35041 [Dimargaris cristalligena]|uniref:Uncharacterized protein n=1 Tax=Dimargaris cristalligena TaxID=215637 RepID=A0A4P9ZRD5_9FUNG|nr:hypothetical protein BJ085DRAFT_35041 [Dimargaris cristalligena]|eukprot:RKP35000.1 hypothetical protein BJ085DRAFT_35041 [Dimargaris cristalligena]